MAITLPTGLWSALGGHPWACAVWLWVAAGPSQPASCQRPHVLPTGARAGPQVAESRRPRTVKKRRWDADKMRGSPAPESSPGRSTREPTSLPRQTAGPWGPGESLARPGPARVHLMNDPGLGRDWARWPRPWQQGAEAASLPGWMLGGAARPPRVPVWPHRPPQSRRRGSGGTHCRPAARWGHLGQRDSTLTARQHWAGGPRAGRGRQANLGLEDGLGGSRCVSEEQREGQ